MGGPSSGALLIEQRVMPLFKKKNPKEQVSRPWATWMEGWSSVTVHVSHLLSLVQRVEVLAEEGAESDSETNQQLEAACCTRSSSPSH